MTKCQYFFNGTKLGKIGKNKIKNKNEIKLWEKLLEST